MIFCLSAVGPSALSAVYSQASKVDLSFVCIFSFLWGSGTMCFSLGIQLLGAGPGTALVMSLLVVIGTVLPLIEDHADDAGSPAALVTIAGLAFAISGFVTSAQSSRIKARAIEASQKGQGGGDNQIILGTSSIATVAADTSPSASKRTAGRNNGTQSPLHESPTSSEVEKGLPSRPPMVLSEKQEETKAKSSHFTAIAVCVAGAVMSSMLQFAFVYGEPLITRAEDEAGVPGVAAPLVIWLLAFSLAAVWNVFYAVYLLCAHKTWGRYAWMGAADFFWKFVNVTVMSVFFVGHIHLYGLAQFLFGGLGPVVAWPLIMSSTVLNGQLWSVFMKEWVGVPKAAMKINILSISLLVTAVTIIAIAGAVL
ncbi:unnamed protein product [Laminaria digitata]